jgi:hypothetical protein
MKIFICVNTGFLHPNLWADAVSLTAPTILLPGTQKHMYIKMSRNVCLNTFIYAYTYSYSYIYIYVYVHMHKHNLMHSP